MTSRRLIFGSAIAALMGLLWALFFVFVIDLPSVKQLQHYKPAVSTQVYAGDDTLIAQYASERRTYAPLSDLPELLTKAFIAIEDRQFFEHTGFSPRGIARAFVRNLRYFRFAQGGSTITQQLAKLLFLKPDKTLTRKIREALLAIKIEASFSKDEILEFYLNQIYLGDGNYGVVSAARYYFCKPVADLNVLEMATLAALPRAPSYYAPTRHPERARKRRDLVLNTMYELDFIYEQQRSEAVDRDLELKPCLPPGRDNYVAAAVYDQAQRLVGQQAIERGDIRIWTTIEPQLQRRAEAAVAGGQKQYLLRHPKAANPDQLQAALIAIEAETGRILALVGGSDFAITQYDRARHAKRQVGSAIKPFVYALGIKNGLSQSSRLVDRPLQYPDGQGGWWKPTNFNDRYFGTVSLRYAIERSMNSVPIQITARYGTLPLIQLLHSAGIDSAIPNNLTIAIGSATLTLQELTSAYTIFATNGVRSSPHLLRKISRNGSAIWRSRVQSRRVLDEETAYIVYSMLRGVTTNGTAASLTALPCTTSGKTGTTNEYNDALFVGTINGITMGVRVGMDDNSSIGETGTRAALPIWKEVAQYICGSRPGSQPAPPADIIEIEIDKTSGQLATSLCGDSVKAAFHRENYPLQSCSEEESVISGRSLL